MIRTGLRPLSTALGSILIGGTTLAGVVALSSPAAASPGPRPATLIYTDRVVGFPQHAVAGNEYGSRSGDPHSFGGSVAPTITLNPASQSVPAGSSVSFTAAATGSPTPSVQWQVSTNSGSSWSAIRGATSTTYGFTAAVSENGYEYEATFSNRAGRATSAPAILTVVSAPPSAPVVTLDPTSQSVAAGSTASFSAAATGSPTPSVQWQVSTNSGGSFSSISGATSTTYSFTAAASENGYEYEAVFTNSSGSATTSPATLTVTAAPMQSSNWSGYADSGASFSATSATWSVPSVSCPTRSSSYSAQWTGIDGFTSSTVEQDGTEADCIGGTPSYDAWYEMYGDTAVNNGDEVELSPATNPVSPGDLVEASVSVSGTTWTLSIVDSSTSHAGWSFSTTISFSAAESSAEWIVERPEVCSFFCTLATLADYGSVSFSDVSTNANGQSETIGSIADTEIEMVNGSVVLALPGPLNQAGNGFTDTWLAG